MVGSCHESQGMLKDNVICNTFAVVLFSNVIVMVTLQAGQGPFDKLPLATFLLNGFLWLVSAGGTTARLCMSSIYTSTAAVMGSRTSMTSIAWTWGALPQHGRRCSKAVPYPTGNWASTRPSMLLWRHQQDVSCWPLVLSHRCAALAACYY